MALHKQNNAFAFVFTHRQDTIGQFEVIICSFVVPRGYAIPYTLYLQETSGGYEGAWDTLLISTTANYGADDEICIQTDSDGTITKATLLAFYGFHSPHRIVFQEGRDGYSGTADNWLFYTSSNNYGAQTEMCIDIAVSNLGR